jgi:hypothetical protein
MKKDSKMTIEDLAQITRDGFQKQDMKIEDLAVLMENHFQKQDTKIEGLTLLMDKKFQQQDEKIEAEFLNYANMIRISFDDQGQEIQKVLNELREFKDECDNKYVSHREFELYKLRLK